MDFLFKQALAPFLECADVWFSFEDTISIDNLDHFACKKKETTKNYGTWRVLSLKVATKSKHSNMISGKNMREMLIRRRPKLGAFFLQTRGEILTFR